MRESVLRICDGCGADIDANGPHWELHARGHDEPPQLNVVGDGPAEPPYALHSLTCLRDLLKRNQSVR